MSNRTPSESDREKADKEKAEGRTQRHVMLFMLFMWGIIGAIGLVLILYGQLQRRRARASAEWAGCVRKDRHLGGHLSHPR